MEWIKVKDRLPIREQDMGNKNYIDIEVIIATKHFVSTDFFKAGNTIDFWSQFNEYEGEVTHWMPLPDLPK